MISYIRTQITLAFIVFEIDVLLNKIEREEDIHNKEILEHKLLERQDMLKCILIDNCYIDEKEIYSE